MKLQFNKKALFIAIILFFTEVLISKTNGFIRHTFGDFLVVILLYFLFKSCIKTSVTNLCYITLFIAYSVECLQLVPFLEWIHLQHNRAANIIFGTTFSFLDLVAYTLGIITTYFIENRNK